jgi:hypothetical protein
MVNPKKEPGFEEPHKTHEQDRVNKHSLKDRWSNRMSSTLIRMSQGASNFWSSMARPHGSKQTKVNSKHSKK